MPNEAGTGAVLGHHFGHGATEATEHIVFLDRQDNPAARCGRKHGVGIQWLDCMHIDQADRAGRPLAVPASPAARDALRSR